MRDLFCSEWIFVCARYMVSYHQYILGLVAAEELPELKKAHSNSGQNMGGTSVYLTVELCEINQNEFS